MRTRVAVLIAALGLAAGAASACGFCVEDRVAAVYDAAQVEQALARHAHVAFFELEGPLAGKATQAAVRSAFESAGALRGTARVSAEPGACAVAYDPKRVSLERLAAAAERALARRGIKAQAIRVIDAGGKLREP